MSDYTIAVIWVIKIFVGKVMYLLFNMLSRLAVIFLTREKMTQITMMEPGCQLEPDIVECEVKWALESITRNKASGYDGISVELFQILKDDAVKVLHSICQQIWKTQQ